MELGLAESILKNYEEIQIAIKRSRQIYIYEHVDETKDKLKNFDYKIEKRKIFEYNY